MSLLAMKRFAITRSSLLVKRAFRLAARGRAALLLAPLLLAIAIAIRLDTPGPVLFRQRRIGRTGSEFEMLKFRSMVAGADAPSARTSATSTRREGLFKIPDDPRITRVGRFIRRRSLDELPQLINVLRGEMSLVGPRPLIPDEDAQIEGGFRRRLDLRARDHRALADARLVADPARRDGHARLPLRRELVAVERPEAAWLAPSPSSPPLAGREPRYSTGTQPPRRDAAASSHSSSWFRMRRSERERICCTLASVSPVSSAISGPVRSPPKRSAISSRSRCAERRGPAASSGSRPSSVSPGGATPSTSAPALVDRALRRRPRSRR